MPKSLDWSSSRFYQNAMRDSLSEDYFRRKIMQLDLINGDMMIMDQDKSHLISFAASYLSKPEY